MKKNIWTNVEQEDRRLLGERARLLRGVRAKTMFPPLLESEKIGALEVRFYKQSVFYNVVDVVKVEPMGHHGRVRLTISDFPDGAIIDNSRLGLI